MPVLRTPRIYLGAPSQRGNVKTHGAETLIRFEGSIGAVFAIALTLLIVESKVPRIS